MKDRMRVFIAGFELYFMGLNIVFHTIHFKNPVQH